MKQRMSQTPALAVELCSIAKRFGEVQANANINLKVPAGTIHGIIGENGAGKSTAMNILYGLYAADSGVVKINDKPVSFSSPSDALRAGLGMVHQHFSLSGTETALDNIILGDEPTYGTSILIPRILRPIDRATAKGRLITIAQKYGLDVPWDAPIESLNVGQQQRVEILKLLYRNAQILILDEPTAVLTPQETEQIFENLRSLKAEGKTILIITHKLKEVLALCDDITVFRSGTVVGTKKTAETNQEELAELMVGRKINLFSKPFISSSSSSKPLLELKDVSLKKGLKNALNNLSFQLFPGEIVGIAGVQGNGQSEMLDLLRCPQDFFSTYTASGSILLNGSEINHVTTSELFSQGMAFISEDRLKEGLLPESTLLENFLLGLHQFPYFCSKGRIHWDLMKSRALAACEEFHIKIPNLKVTAGGLSGGNQQKLIIARELIKAPKVIVAAQPTRGVDIGAIEFIHNQLRALQQQGSAVLLISSELSEILSLANRILVFFEGKIVAQMSSKEATELNLGLAMGGSAAQTASVKVSR